MNSIKDNINKQNKVRHRKRGEQGSSISDKFIQEKELQNRTQMIKTEVDWEAEGDWESGTEGMVTNQKKKMVKYVIRCYGIWN